MGSPAGTVLIHGPDGVGKFTAALDTARRLNCSGCKNGSCAACRQAAGGNHPNISTAAPDEKDKIGIEAASQFQSQLQYRQFAPGRRVMIIRDSHTLTVPAANALLKTLEEPPAGSLIILTATAPSALLSTIVSRARLVYFPPPGQQALIRFLVNQRHIEPGAAAELAELSGGLPGVALSLAGNEDEWEFRRQGYVLAENFRGSQLFERLQLIGRISKDQDMMDVLLTALVQKTRHLARGGQVPPQALGLIVAAQQRMKANVSPRAVFEALAVQLP